MSWSMVRWCTVALVLVLGVADAAMADVRSLLGQVPGEANALVIIDVEKLLNSPMGKSEGWRDKLADAYENKPLVVLPGAKRVVMAALLEPSSGQTTWEVSVMDMDTAPSVKDIAKAEKGYVDKLGDKSAAWSPINAYFVQLKPNLFGTVCPANRQFAARWVKQKQVLAGEFLSNYLQQAAMAADQGAEVLMALDLEDMTSTAKVSRRLREESFDSLQGKEINGPALAKTLASIKGLTLRIEVGEKATGKGVIDFGSDTQVLGDLAKPLLLEMLGKYGMALPEFEDWKVTTTGNQVVVSGTLSPDGLRQLLSVVDPPVPAQFVASASTPASKDPASSGNKETTDKAAITKASQKYYQTVAKIMENLEKNIGKGAKSASLADSAGWMQRDARRIERLPIMKVDSDLVAWGTETAARLREISTAFDIGHMETRARTDAIRSQSQGGSGSYSGGGYSGGGYSDGYSEDSSDQWIRDSAARQARSAELRQAAQEQKANAYKSAEQIIQSLRGSRIKIRTTMTDRYGVEF